MLRFYFYFIEMQPRGLWIKLTFDRLCNPCCATRKVIYYYWSISITINDVKKALNKHFSINRLFSKVSSFFF